MRVYFKKLHENAKLPKYANPGDAGLDLTAMRVEQGPYYWTYGTGLAMSLPEGYAGLIFPRSSVSNTRHSLANSVGLIDSGYRGEIMFRFRIENYNQPPYKIGDRIGQLLILPYPEIQVLETTELNNTSRGTGGFGSSGS